METIERYKEIIITELTYRRSIPILNAPDLERQLVVSKGETEFLLLSYGWHKKRYRHNIVFHLEIKHRKVWIHQDNTDVGIATKLVEGGIPAKDIVLGFLPAYAREMSGFAA